nr:hypothetical protein BJQ95_02159 [Cryobacterium sp. SO1]
MRAIRSSAGHAPTSEGQAPSGPEPTRARADVRVGTRVARRHAGGAPQAQRRLARPPGHEGYTPSCGYAGLFSVLASGPPLTFFGQQAVELALSDAVLSSDEVIQVETRVVLRASKPPALAAGRARSRSRSRKHHPPRRQLRLMRGRPHWPQLPSRATTSRREYSSGQHVALALPSSGLSREGPGWRFGRPGGIPPFEQALPTEYVWTQDISCVNHPGHTKARTSPRPWVVAQLLQFAAMAGNSPGIPGSASGSDQNCRSCAHPPRFRAWSRS